MTTRDYARPVGLFSRRRSPENARRAQAEAIDDFWRWWQADGATSTAKALADHDPQRMVGPITGHVHAIAAGLSWELAKGSDEHEHVLVVTSGGDPALRAAARRWRLAAPPPDPTWEYDDARRPAQDGFTLQLDGVGIDAAQAQVTARVEGPRVHVVVHHPALERLPDTSRSSAAHLLLDATLGERVVETWVGEISASHLPPLDPVALTGLGAVVDHLRGQHLDRDGNPTWVLLQGQRRDGTPLLATAQVPLTAATAPHLDTHVAVTVPYKDVTDAGFPGSGSLDELRRFEDHLTERLGGSGRLVAHETRGGVRLLHYYVDGATPAVAQLEAVARGWGQGRARVDATDDPGWHAVRHLAT